jgi:predicted small lipoprotein YifL
MFASGMFASALSRATAGAALLLMLMLAACGQKGPLYLPDQGGEVVTRPGGQAQSQQNQQSQPSQQQSPEVAPQPATQTPPDSSTRPEEKKPQNPK